MPQARIRFLPTAFLKWWRFSRCGMDLRVLRTPTQNSFKRVVGLVGSCAYPDRLGVGNLAHAGLEGRQCLVDLGQLLLCQFVAYQQPGSEAVHPLGVRTDSPHSCARALADDDRPVGTVLRSAIVCGRPACRP